MLSHSLLVGVVVAGAGAAVGALVLLLLLRRTLRGRAAVPLPPIQPLAHRREQQLAHFEAAIRVQSTYGPTLLAMPAPFSLQLDSPSLGGSNVSLLGKDSPSSRHTSYAPTGEGTEELATLPPLDPLQSVPLPLFTPVHSSSSVNLYLNDTQPYPPSSFPLTSSAAPRRSRSLSRPTRDDHSPHRRAPSAAASRAPSRGGLPHGPHSQVQIVLPAPLGTGYAPSSTRHTQSEHDTPSDRTSIVDRWVPVGTAL